MKLLLLRKNIKTGVVNNDEYDYYDNYDSTKLETKPTPTIGLSSPSTSSNAKLDCNSSALTLKTGNTTGNNNNKKKDKNTSSQPIICNVTTSSSSSTSSSEVDVVTDNSYSMASSTSCTKTTMTTGKQQKQDASLFSKKECNTGHQQTMPQLPPKQQRRQRTGRMGRRKIRMPEDEARRRGNMIQDGCGCIYRLFGIPFM